MGHQRQHNVSKTMVAMSRVQGINPGKNSASWGIGAPIPQEWPKAFERRPRMQMPGGAVVGVDRREADSAQRVT